MRFFLDENFPRKAAVILSALGHEVFDIRGSDCEGMSDNEIFEKAQESKAFFLTTDRDFFHTIPFLYPEHEGIVVIALSHPNTASILAKLEIALQHITKHSATSQCLLLTDRKISFLQRD
jgi:predicted nuclease of predicted toxin-antitoxin system